MEKFNVTKNNVLLLTSSALVLILVGMIYSIQAPFYPAEAKSKNASVTAYGFVFSSAELATIIGMPVIGKYLTKLGTMNCFIACSIISSISTISFGFLNQINDSTWFITVSILIRIIDSFTHGVVYVSTVVLISAVFPWTTARNIVISQLTYDTGITIGPAVGTIFYNIGGFTLPFVVFGFIQLFIVLITRWSLGIEVSKNNDILMNIDKTNEIDSKLNIKYKNIFKVPHVLVYSFCTTVSGINYMFVQILLEPYLRQFDLNTTNIGFIFFSSGAMLVIGFIFFTFICEKIIRIHLITCLGIFLITISTLLIGPDPVFKFEQNLWLLIFNVLLLSFAVAIIFGSGNYLSYQELLKRGFTDNESMSALMTGLLLGTISFGCFIGPIVAGTLFDHFGFRKSTRVLTILNLFTTVVIILFSYCFVQPHHHQINTIIKTVEEETRPLLISQRARRSKP